MPYAPIIARPFILTISILQYNSYQLPGKGCTNRLVGSFKIMGRDFNIDNDNIGIDFLDFNLAFQGLGLNVIKC